MSRFRIFKELKKSLKRKRRHVWSLGAGAVLFLLAALAGSWMAYRLVSYKPSQVLGEVEASPVWMDHRQSTTDETSREQLVHSLRGRNGQIELVLHRTYLCGEETRQLGSHTTLAAAELLQAHREWEASLDSAGRLMLEEAVDDLSPQCRRTAYIGLDKDGNLSLYDGPPWQEKVVRTFFQLDVDMMESQLSEDRVRELASGIRVTDKEEYNSVLSTLNEFASVRSQAIPQKE